MAAQFAIRMRKLTFIEVRRFFETPILLLVSWRISAFGKTFSIVWRISLNFCLALTPSGEVATLTIGWDDHFWPAGTLLRASIFLRKLLVTLL